ncbi:MAG: threonine synthase [Roseivirga sp.]|jgi:threonine synthase
MSKLNVLDGVKPRVIKIPRDTAELSLEVKDKERPLIDRLESLQDIISAEVGDTALTRARSLEREYDIRQLYIKYEGDNPTGTQKDRIAFAQIQDALRRGFDVISAATCGNYGVAVAYAAYLSGIRCVIYIPESFHTERAVEMQAYNAEIVRLPGTYEDVVSASSKIAEEKGHYDSNPGGLNTPLQITAYAEIANEIYDVLRDAPKFLACPVSNGTLLAGIYRGFVSLYKRGKTSRIPHFVAGSSSYKNPIISSFIKKLDHCEDLKAEKIKETKINEPLINWHSFDGEEALYALKTSQGYAAHVSDRKMHLMSNFLLKNGGLTVLPASTAGLIALLEKNQSLELPNDRYVAVLTARN